MHHDWAVISQPSRLILQRGIHVPETPKAESPVKPEDEKEADLKAVLNEEEKVISAAVKEGKLWYKSKMILFNIILIWVGVGVQYALTYHVPPEEYVPLLIATGINAFLRTQTSEALRK